MSYYDDVYTHPMFEEALELLELMYLDHNDVAYLTRDVNDFSKHQPIGCLTCERYAKLKNHIGKYG